mgnify:CR=1 FL=1
MEIRKRTGAATWLLGILAAVMLICSGKTAYAAEQAELSGGNVDAENGKTVQYAVTLENNPGLWAVKFTASYDSEALKLTAVKAGDIFTEEEITPPQELTDTPYVFLGVKNTLENTDKEGVVVTLEFEVDKDAQAKDYEVKLEVTQAINLEGQDISVAAKNGNISVVPCIHEKEWKVTKPGCETAGKKEYVCTKCGEVFESEELPATGHVDTEIRNQKEAGAEPGYTGDTYCRTCGKLLQAGSVIPAVKETEKETETVAEQETTAQQTTAEETKKSVSEKIGNALKTGDAAAIAVMAVLLAASGVLAFATRKKMIVRKK